MTRIFLAGAAALALLAGGAAVQASPASTSGSGVATFDGASADVSAARKKSKKMKSTRSKKKMMKRAGRTSTGVPRGRTDSPNVGSGTPKGQQQKGVNRY